MQNKVGVALGALAVVLVIAAVIGPWWVVDTTGRLGGFTVTSHAEYNLFGRTETSQSNLSSSSNTTAYASLPQTGSVFGVALILCGLGLVLGVGAVLIGVLPGANPPFRRFATVAGVLAFLLLLIAPVYVMSALPGAVNQDSGASSSNAFSGFWGTRSASFGGFLSATTTWAAGWAWYAALVAAIVFLMASVAMVASRKPASQGLPPASP